MGKKFLTLVFLMFGLTLFGGCGNSRSDERQTIVFGDLTWDSAAVYNRVLAFILENGLTGYKAEFTPGATNATVLSVKSGDIDVMPELWVDGFEEEVLADLFADGTVEDLGPSIPLAKQGLYLPSYFLKENPGLKSLNDLPDYWEKLKDPEDESRGIVYLAIAGWASHRVTEEVFDKFNLGEKFNKGLPGSDTALAAVIFNAYQRGEGIIAFYWEPTVLMGKVEMELLEDTGFDYNFENPKANKLINKQLYQKAPEFVEILKKFEIPSRECSEILAYMEKENLSHQQAALWFLRNRQEMWGSWMNSEQATKVKLALTKEGA